MRKYFVALILPALVLAILCIHSPKPPSPAMRLPLRAGLSPHERVTVDINQTHLTQALIMYSELIGRKQLPTTSPISQQADEFLGGCLGRWHLVKTPAHVPSGIEYHRDGLFTVGEVKEHLEALFAAKGIVLIPKGRKYFRPMQSPKAAEKSSGAKPNRSA